MLCIYFSMMYLLFFFVFPVFLHYSDSANTQRLHLSCAQIKKFLDGHNVRRLRVAHGDVPPQPPAANMAYMVWDEELAKKAAIRAENGSLGHNDVGTQRWSLVGENVYINFFPELIVVPNIEEALDFWFGEHKIYGFERYSLALPLSIGHYTQMAWAKSSHLGCGISQKTENDWTTTLIVCYYGPAGNILGQVPYKRSKAPGKLHCVTGTCQKPYGNYC